MSDDIPDPWRTAAERRGVSPTYRPLAQRAKVSHETVRRLIQGRPTSKATMRKVAEALGVDIEEIHAWRGESAPDYGREYEPDAAASLLTSEERELLNHLIRLLTRDRQEQEPDHDETANTRAGGSPALDATVSHSTTPPGPLGGSGSQPPAHGSGGRARRG